MTAVEDKDDPTYELLFSPKWRLNKRIWKILNDIIEKISLRWKSESAKMYQVRQNKRQVSGCLQTFYANIQC